MKCDKCGKVRKEVESYEWIFGKKIEEAPIITTGIEKKSKVAYGEFNRIWAGLCHNCLNLERRKKKLQGLGALLGFVVLGSLTILSLAKGWEWLISLAIGIVALFFGAFSFYCLNTGYSKEGAKEIIKDFASKKAEPLGLEYCWSPEEYEKIIEPLTKTFTLEGKRYMGPFRYEKCIITLNPEKAEFNTSYENLVIPKRFAENYIQFTYHAQERCVVIKQANKKYKYILDEGDISKLETWAYS